MNINITSYCSIQNGNVKHNGELLFEFASKETNTKELYGFLQLKYPKFFKMDRLSKMAVLGCEVLLSSRNLKEEYSSNRVGIYFSNQSASLDTDREHQKSIEDRGNYFPSPAVFVYTLPNIAIGEVAIKHKLNGPNAFFIFDKFEPDFFATYIQNQFLLNKIDAGIFGWVEADENCLESVLFLAEKGKGNWPLEADSLKQLYIQ